MNPSQEEIDTCATFFPESEMSDVVHAATCLYANAILITNDNRFNKIKTAKIIKVWSNTKAIKRQSLTIQDLQALFLSPKVLNLLATASRNIYLRSVHNKSE